MKTKRSDTSRWIQGTVCLLAILVGSSCGSVLRSAAHEHAQASISVAQTLERAAAALRCGELAAEAGAECKSAVRVVSDQAQALRDSAKRLERSAQ